MTMPVTDNVLRDLHRIHQQLSDLRERRDRGPKQIKAREANVARFENELSQIKNESKAAKMVADKKQLELKVSENKLADLNVKLNQAKSNREYQAFKDQIAADTMSGSVLADEILEALEKIDEIAIQVKAAEERVAKAKEELARATQQVREQEAGILTDIERLEGELKQTEPQLPDDFREAYHRIVKGKGSDAMAPLEGDTCGGCFQTLTANIRSMLLMNKVVCCQTCGRLLYMPEDRTAGGSK